VIRDYIPSLPRSAWKILTYDAVSAIGGGMVMPFLIIYLHRVRGLDLDIAGLAIATVAIAGLASGPLSGFVTDRAGARVALLAALGISAAGALALILVRETWHAFAACAIFGAGEAAFWPAMQTLLAGAVDERHRGAVFSVHYATINVGIGIGGILGGLVADISRPETFEFLYLIDALTFLPFMFVLFRMKEMGTRVERPPGDEPGSYGHVLKDRLFLRIWGLMAFLVAIGYSQAESAFPAFAVEEGGLSTRGLGIAFAVNTTVVVLAQLVVLKRAEGMRRTRGLLILCGFWALYWVTTLVGAERSGWTATAVFSLAFAFFALGETLVSPTIGTMVVDISPSHIRGRYTAVYALSWTVGSIVGPAAAGYFLHRDLGRAFVMGLIACCGIAALASLRLERHVPVDANLVKPSD
jgi:MFS family permease